MDNIMLYNESNSLLDKTQNSILRNFFGYTSGILIGIMLIPQVIKVYKTKSTKDLSYIFLFISLIAAIFKLIYGILINELPIVITSPIILIETLLIIFAKVIYDKKYNDNVPVNTKEKSCEIDNDEIEEVEI